MDHVAPPPPPAAATAATPAAKRLKTSMNVIAVSRQWPDTHPREFLVISAVLWLALYWALRARSQRRGRRAGYQHP